MAKTYCNDSKKKHYSYHSSFCELFSLIFDQKFTQTRQNYQYSLMHSYFLFFNIFIYQLNQKSMEEADQITTKYVEKLRFFHTALSNKPSQVAYIFQSFRNYSYAHLRLQQLHPQKDPHFQRISQLQKYSIDLFGSVLKPDQELRANKLHVLNVRSEEEIYKDEPLRYLQAYQAHTAYNIKKILSLKKDNPKYKQNLIKYVQSIEQEFKQQYSKQKKSSLNDKQLKIYLQNCPQETLIQCFQRFKVCTEKSHRQSKGQQSASKDESDQEEEQVQYSKQSNMIEQI